MRYLLRHDLRNGTVLSSKFRALKHCFSDTVGEYQANTRVAEFEWLRRTAEMLALST